MRPRPAVLPLLPHPAEDLSADDDLLSWILVDQLGVLPGEKLGVHPQQVKFKGPDFKTEEVLDIVRETVVRNGNDISTAVARLREFDLIKDHLETKATSAQRDRCIQHLRRYLMVLAPTSRVEIHTTDRYSHVTNHPELAVYATRPLVPGEVLHELQGSVVPLPEAWREELDIGDDFNVRNMGGAGSDSEVEEEEDEEDETEGDEAGPSVSRGEEDDGGAGAGVGEGADDDAATTAGQRRRKKDKGKSREKNTEHQGARRSDRTKRRDFSIIWSGLKRCHQLFLGPARFINHDCHPNVELFRQGKYITFRVTRPIRIGDELTTFYAENYFGRGNIECLCLSCEVRGVGGFTGMDKEQRAGLRGGRGRSRRKSATAMAGGGAGEGGEGSTSASRDESVERGSTRSTPAPSEMDGSEMGESGSMTPRKGKDKAGPSRLRQSIRSSPSVDIGEDETDPLSKDEQDKAGDAGTEDQREVSKDRKDAYSRQVIDIDSEDDADERLVTQADTSSHGSGSSIFKVMHELKAPSASTPLSRFSQAENLVDLSMETDPEPEGDLDRDGFLFVHAGQGDTVDRFLASKGYDLGFSLASEANRNRKSLTVDITHAKDPLRGADRATAIELLTPSSVGSESDIVYLSTGPISNASAQDALQDEDGDVELTTPRQIGIDGTAFRADDVEEAETEEMDDGMTAQEGTHRRPRGRPRRRDASLNGAHVAGSEAADSAAVSENETSSQRSPSPPLLRARSTRQAALAIKPWMYMRTANARLKAMQSASLDGAGLGGLGGPGETDYGHGHGTSAAWDLDVDPNAERCITCVKTLERRIWYGNRYFEHCPRCIRHALIFELPWPAHRLADVTDFPPSHLVPSNVLPRRITSAPLPTLEKYPARRVERATLPSEPETSASWDPARLPPDSRPMKWQRRLLASLRWESYTVDQMRLEQWQVQEATERKIREKEEARAARKAALEETKRRRNEGKVQGSGVWARYAYETAEEAEKREREKRLVIVDGPRRRARVSYHEDDLAGTRRTKRERVGSSLAREGTADQQTEGSKEVKGKQEGTPKKKVRKVRPLQMELVQHAGESMDSTEGAAPSTSMDLDSNPTKRSPTAGKGLALPKAPIRGMPISPSTFYKTLAARPGPGRPRSKPLAPQLGAKKRGRGRPPKNSVGPGGSELKRPRGRPRKSALPSGMRGSRAPFVSPAKAKQPTARSGARVSSSPAKPLVVFEPGMTLAEQFIARIRAIHPNPLTDVPREESESDSEEEEAEEGGAEGGEGDERTGNVEANQGEDGADALNEDYGEDQVDEGREVGGDDEDVEGEGKDGGENGEHLIWA